MAIGVYALGALVIAVFNGMIFQFVQTLGSQNLRYRKRMGDIQEFVRFHALPRELGKRVTNYVDLCAPTTPRRHALFCPCAFASRLCIGLKCPPTRSHPDELLTHTRVVLQRFLRHERYRRGIALIAVACQHAVGDTASDQQKDGRAGGPS